MEDYRKKLRKRNWILLAALMTLATLLTAMLLLRHQYLTRMPDFFQGYAVGAFAGAIGSLSLLLFSTVYAMRKPERLKKLYIQETDERTVLIHQKTFTYGLAILIFALVIGVIVACFFNETVFFTLLVIIFLLMFILLGTKTYFDKKL